MQFEIMKIWNSRNFDYLFVQFFFKVDKDGFEMRVKVFFFNDLGNFGGEFG